MKTQSSRNFRVSGQAQHGFKSVEGSKVELLRWHAEPLELEDDMS